MIERLTLSLDYWVRIMGIVHATILIRVLITIYVRVVATEKIIIAAAPCTYPALNRNDIL